ncbi:MAG TPA: hypothetical protein VIG30_15920 [Ktedonobacterales bacterium]|jgi:hypothetical protein
MSQERDQEHGQESDAAARQRRLEALRALASTPPPSSAPPLSAPPATPSPAAAPSGTPPAPAAAATTAPARPTDLASMVVGSAKRRRARDASAAPTTRRPRRVPVALRAGLAVVAVAAVVAVGTLFWLHRPAPVAPPPDPVSIRFNSATMACPQSASWSPDGTKVAVLGFLSCGQQGNFNGGPSTGGTLLIYNATSGHLDADLSLDTTTETLVPQSVRSDPNALRAVMFTYDTVMWSPNGRQLVIHFSLNNNSNEQFNPNGPPTGGIDYGQGLIVVTAASHAASLLSQPAPPQINYTGTSFDALPVTRWDMSAGTSTLTTLPQALAYQWNGDDTLTPSIPLPATASAPAPPAPQGAVGNPDGGQSFTSYQAGYVNFGQFCSNPNDLNQQQICCPITTYLSGGFWAFAAWSPDGRVLLLPYGTAIGANGKFAAAAGTPTAAPQPGCPLPGQENNSSLANLPVRDAAMAGVLNTLVPQPVYTQFGPPPSTTAASGASFTWSPDGRRVVVTEQTNGPPATSTSVFSIYDTASGKQSVSFTTARLIALGHLPANEINPSQSFYATTTLWSPNSQRLLVLDANDHFLLLLGPKSLAG